MIQIDSEFKALIPSLSDDEYSQLEINLLRDGCRDPLVLWGDILLDGHNRYAICQRHGLSFETVQMSFDSRDDAKIWMIFNQLGRRNVDEPMRIKMTNTQLRPLLEAKAKLNMSLGGQMYSPKEGLSTLTNLPNQINTRDELAKAAGVSVGTYYKAVKVLQEAPPEIVEAYENKEMSANEAYNKLKQIKQVEQSRAKTQERIEQATTIAKQYNLDNFVLGDCVDVLKALPDNSVRLLLTDPPYGMAFQSNRRTASEPLPTITNDDSITSAIDTFSMMLRSAYHAMMQDSHMLVFCHWRYEHLFMNAIELAGFSIDASLIWVKENHGSGDLTSFAPKHERIIYARRGNVGISPRIPDVLIESRQYDTGHPTEKPVSLLKRLIEVCTVENELVLDPFAGTGATAIASSELNRKFYCVEMDASWHSLATQRIVNHHSMNNSQDSNLLKSK